MKKKLKGHEEINELAFIKEDKSEKYKDLKILVIKQGENLKNISGRIFVKLKKIFFKLNDKIKKISRRNKIIVTTMATVLIISAFAGDIYYKDYLNKQNKIKEDKIAVITTNAAEEYFYTADYDKSIEEYQKLVQKSEKSSPDKSAIWKIKLAEVYSVKNDIDNSKKYIKFIKDLNSSDVEILNYVVFTEFMNKDYKIAMEDGEKALVTNPKDKKLIKTMVAVYMSNSLIDKAKKLLENYPLDNKSAYDTAEYSRMLMLLGQKDKGYGMLKSAYNIDNDEYKIYDLLSQISLYNKNKLLEDISNLLKKEPEELAYKMWLAKIYSLAPETAGEASKIMTSIEGKNIGKIEAQIIKAAILQNTKQTDKADELINKIISENKNDYRVLHTAGWFYLNKKDYNKAEYYCKESIVKNKEYTDNYAFLMPEILKAKGLNVEGEPFFRTAMFMEPYNYNIMLNIAAFYGKTTSSVAMSLNYYKLASLLNPSSADIKYTMAMLYVNDKKMDEAISLLKECIKLDESVPKYHRTLGTVYYLKNDGNNAIAEIRFAYNTDQNDILTLNNAGCYYLSFEGTVDRGFFNLYKAKEGITKYTEKNTVDIINANYDKAKKIYDDYYSSSNANKSLKVPEFSLFY